MKHSLSKENQNLIHHAFSMIKSNTGECYRNKLKVIKVTLTIIMLDPGSLVKQMLK